MTSDQHQPDPGQAERAAQAEGGPERAVEAALHGSEPSIDVADLQVEQGEDTMPVVDPTAGQGGSYDSFQEAEQASGEDPLDESRIASEYMEPGVEHRRSRGPDEIRGPA